jgi:hypothetical protein
LSKGREFIPIGLESLSFRKRVGRDSLFPEPGETCCGCWQFWGVPFRFGNLKGMLDVKRVQAGQLRETMKTAVPTALAYQV